MTPANILLYIIKLVIIDNKNATQISSTLKDKIVNINFSYNIITNIIENFRFYITHYIRGQCTLESISELNKNENLAIDESDFVGFGDKKIWVVGIVNFNKRKLIKFRDNTIKKC